MIELFLVFKWLGLLLLWFFGVQSSWVGYLIIYFIFNNIHTYFDHHVWSIRGSLNPDRIKMRFVMVLQAIFFNIVCFAYLFSNQYREDFSWGSFGSSKWLVPISFSFMNTLSGGSSVAAPISEKGVVLVGLQVVTTFIFLTIILSKAANREGE